jgi:hypothetical protein
LDAWLDDALFEPGVHARFDELGYFWHVLEAAAGAD